jgi:hypothetical protein
MTRTDENASLFEGWDVISTYTRAQAIEDGVLIDVTEAAREAGFKYPVAITTLVHGEVVATPEIAIQQGESDSGRLWDVLWMARVAIKNQRPGDEPDRINFRVIATDDQGRKVNHRLWSHCGPGDNAEPVITIMMQGED